MGIKKNINRDPGTQYQIECCAYWWSLHVNSFAIEVKWVDRSCCVGKCVHGLYKRKSMLAAQQVRTHYYKFIQLVYLVLMYHCIRITQHADSHAIRRTRFILLTCNWCSDCWVACSEKVLKFKIIIHIIRKNLEGQLKRQKEMLLQQEVPFFQ